MTADHDTATVELVARTLAEHRPTRGPSVSMGVTCECGHRADGFAVGGVLLAQHQARAVLDALTAAGRLRTGDPQRTWDDFWASLCTTDDGQMDPEKVKAELHDYYLIDAEVSKAYDELTDGRISKPHTAAHHVVSEAQEAFERALRADGWFRVDPNEPHLIEVRPDGWTIQHPLRCRPNLFACALNRVGEDLPGPPQSGAGVYECDLVDGKLTLTRGPLPATPPTGTEARDA